MLSNHDYDSPEFKELVEELDEVLRKNEVHDYVYIYCQSRINDEKIVHIYKKVCRSPVCKDELRGSKYFITKEEFKSDYTSEDIKFIFGKTYIIDSLEKEGSMKEINIDKEIPREELFKY